MCMSMYDSEAVREYFEDIKREQEETEQTESEEDKEAKGYARSKRCNNYEQ